MKIKFKQTIKLFQKHRNYLFSLLGVALIIAIYIALFEETKRNVLILFYSYSLWVILVNVYNVYYLGNKKFLFFSVSLGLTRKFVFHKIVLDCMYNLLFLVGGITVYGLFSYINNKVMIFNLISYLIIFNIVALFILTSFLGLLFSRTKSNPIALFTVCAVMISMVLLASHFYEVNLLIIFGILILISTILAIILYRKISHQYLSHPED